MSDESFEQGVVPPGRLFLWMAGLGAGTGALAGGGETVLLAFRLDLWMETADIWLLGLAAILLNAALGAFCGAGAGLVAQWTLAGVPPWKRYRAAFTMTVTLLAWIFLFPSAWEAVRTVIPGRMAAVAMLGLSLPITVWYNAGYWFRRLSIGAGPVVGWRPLSVALALATVGIAPFFYTVPPVDMPAASNQPNLILITVDTLRRDHLGIYGGLVSTPRMDALGKLGLVVEEAVTPLPETAPSHASMFTGRHPAEHRVTSNGQTLTGGKMTLAEHVGLLGYRTAAFVSSFAVDSRGGLGQGFQLYDDDFFPYFRGFSELQVARFGLRLLMRFGDPADYPFLLERPAPRTLDRAVAWAGSGTGPFFLWVHLFEPHSPYERHDGQPNAVDHRAILAQEPGYNYRSEEVEALRDLYRMEVEYTDTQVGRLLDDLKAAGLMSNAVVLLTADHGESLGDHDIYFNHHGLYDDVLRVPFLLWSSAPAWTPGTRVAGQASVLDVANSLLGAGGLPLMAGTRSESMGNRALGAVTTPEAALLLGREGMSLREGQLFGVRSSNGIKYIQHSDGTEEFYDLTSDPFEKTNIAAEQTRGVQIGRANVDALRRALPDPATVDAATRAMLKELGYIE